MNSTFLKLTTVAGISALLLTGCSGGSAPAEPIPPITDPVAGEVPAGILEGHTLTYAGDGGTTQDAQMSSFFTPFAEASGVTFNQDSPQTIAKVESQVKSGNIQWDLISSFPDTIARSCGTLFEKLDMSKIDTSHMPEGLLGGSECGVPSIIYGTVLAYDTEAFAGNEPSSWADFFDTKTYPGTRALYSGDGKVDGASVQAAALGAGWDPATDEFSVEWAQKGLDALETIKDDLVFYGTGAQAQQMIEAGESKMTGVWNGRVLAAEKNGASAAVAWDQWVKITDYFAIVKDSPNAEAAYYAINYAYGAAQQAQWTEESGYSPANSESQPQVDELTQSYIVTTPERQKTGVALDVDFWSDLDRIKPLQDRWAGLVAGA